MNEGVLLGGKTGMSKDKPESRRREQVIPGGRGLGHSLKINVNISLRCRVY